MLVGLHMLRQGISRRELFAFAAALLLAPTPRLAAEPLARRGTFVADVGILYQVLKFHLEGGVDESIDREAGRYEVRVTGQGSGIANRIESSGELRDGRWVPLRSASWFQVHGRESWTRIAYDYGRRSVEYHARGETFFLRRVRVVDDVVAMPDGAFIDDGISASLNYRDGNWKARPDGNLVSHVVRRRQSANEGADDVASSYRAEIIPLELRIAPDPETRKPTALLDLSRFSSWARENRPARIVFDDERRPALITGSMILGTSVTIRLG
jgi:hypothetical protein